MLTASIAAMAKTPGLNTPAPSSRAPMDADIIITPPEVDPEAMKKPSKNVDPDINVPSGKKGKKNWQKIPKKKRSKDTNCKDSAELCKQNNPR